MRAQVSIKPSNPVKRNSLSNKVARRPRAAKASTKRDLVTTNKTKGGKLLNFLAANKRQDLTASAREALVLDHRVKAQKMAKSILRRWNARLELSELESIVDLSLCEAVKRFDPTKGASFITFLFYHLKGNLVRCVVHAANANVVYPTDSEFEEIFSGESRGYTALDIAESLSGSEPELPEEILLQKEMVSLSREACLKLDDLEKMVIERIYIQGEQLLDIAKSLGYSRCHISRVKRRALETLEAELKNRLSENATRASMKNGANFEIVQRQVVVN